jgi:hypothetical protein
VSTEHLIGGADAYTDLAQVVQETEIDTPEATPTIISAGIGSFVASFNTVRGGC